MYREPTPLFDVPDFPPLRRMKPLPKRRRMGTPPDVGLGLPPIGANPTAEDLIAHAESLTAQLQYYMPSLEGMPDILKPGGLLAGASGAADLASVTQAVYALGELRGPLDESEEQTEYADMLAQPGNTKKRKVPLNMAGFPVAQDHRGGDDSLEEERDRERLLEGRDPKGWPGADGATDGGSGGMRTLKNLSRVTLASLRHKELLRNRKEQLAGVITSGSHADTLALDQALASNYPFSKPATGQPRVRLSRRNRLRVMRTGHEHRRTLPTRTLATPVTVPKDDFTFECESATSGRHALLREEVARLHDRFEAELKRQAAKAEEEAKEASALAIARSKRTDRQPQRPRTANTGKRGSDQNVSHPEQALLGPSASGKKKKKRSALANASNPHHLRNYVPSRLPHTGLNTTQATQHVQSTLGPPPLRFLSAEIAPDRRSKSQGAAPSLPPTEAANEWICPFCEYNLFYGDERAFRRAVRSRKKILRRRERARERAAAAASGKPAPVAPSGRVTEEDEEALFEPPHDDVPASITSQMKWKGERNRDADQRGDNQTRGGGSG